MVGIGQRSDTIWAGELSGDSIVATVNGKSIALSEVAIPYDAPILKLRFLELHKVDPTTPKHMQLMEDLQRQVESENLVNNARSIVRKDLIHSHLSTPSLEAIHRCEERLARQYKRETSEKAHKAQEALHVLLESYTEVVDNGANPDDVYHRRLAGVMSLEEWRLRLRFEATPERRQAMERVLDSGAIGVIDFQVVCRDLVIADMLNNLIDKELIGSDPEYAEYLRFAQTDPSHPSVRGKGPMYQNAKRYQWWEARYREADVRILDERFEDAWPYSKGSVQP